MTQVEKKATQSEISGRMTSIQTSTLELGTCLYSTVLEGNQRFRFVSPINGYLNFLLHEASSHCTLNINQHDYLIQEGENIFIQVKKGVPFELESYHSDNTLLLMVVNCKALMTLEEEHTCHTGQLDHGLVTQSDNRVSLTLKQVIELNEEKSCLAQIKLQSLLLELLIYQIEGLQVDSDVKKISLSKNHFEKIQMVKRLIDSDLSKNYTISDLAKAVGTNNQYLKKYFKQQYGKTVMSYMTEMKMEHAKKLILMGKYRIADIARICGYKYSTHFTTAFKKYFGFVPNSLRYLLVLASNGTFLSLL